MLGESRVERSFPYKSYIAAKIVILFTRGPDPFPPKTVIYKTRESSLVPEGFLMAQHLQKL